MPCQLATVLLLLSTLRLSVALRFSWENTFKIVQFTDLHYGTEYLHDQLTTTVQKRILEWERPDLVVFSGDLVSGNLYSEAGPGWFKKRWEYLSEAVLEADTPWATTLGNHDREADLDGPAIIRLDQQTSKLSLTQQSPSEIEGVTNYWLDIHAHDSNQPAAARIWLLDSLEFGCQGRDGWGCVGPSTVRWLSAQHKLADVPALAFVHIPPPEFMAAWNSGDVRGSKSEPVNCPSGDSGLLQALKAVNVSAVFSGHDHDNNFDAMHSSGIRFAYGHKTGYGSYGPPVDWQHGARVVLLRQGQAPAQAESWIRLEDGSRIDQGPTSSEDVQAQRQSECDGSTAYCFSLEASPYKLFNIPPGDWQGDTPMSIFVMRTARSACIELPADSLLSTRLADLVSRRALTETFTGLSYGYGSYGYGSYGYGQYGYRSHSG
ncbi:hypothetical protein WJX73_005719 [Symbiochloris irregularis]|uniref:Calcineurin-like phosphoesterase domain-containing protein n=1 Tax=Symbiochloris irregularis TaxID=706552 RepID=A0AAW1PEG3_9CHLO